MISSLSKLSAIKNNFLKNGVNCKNCLRASLSLIIEAIDLNAYLKLIIFLILRLLSCQSEVFTNPIKLNKDLSLSYFKMFPF